MSEFTIVDGNTVSIRVRGQEYTVTRRGGGFRVAVVNAMVRAHNRGFPTPRDFQTLEDVEKRYKGLKGITVAFPPAPSAEAEEKESAREAEP